MKMKKIIVIISIAALLTPATIHAQHQMSSKEKMNVFAAWTGRWEGEGWMRMGPGEPKTSKVVEKIESKLDGVVYLVEGIGKALDPQSNQEVVVHQALALLSYDTYTNQYKFKTHLKDGRGTEALMVVLGDNKFEWGFDVPNRGKTRYIITIDPVKKTWNEIGEFSSDGANWSKFFEMNLKKVE